MQNDLSFDFLTCLDDYRKKYLKLKAFRAWQRYLTANLKRYRRACLALEYCSFQTMRKCFNALRKPQKKAGSLPIPYSYGVYLILLAASTFLPQKTFTSYGYRIDKLLSLFKQVKLTIRKDV